VCRPGIRRSSNAAADCAKSAIFVGGIDLEVFGTGVGEEITGESRGETFLAVPSQLPQGGIHSTIALGPGHVFPAPAN